MTVAAASSRKRDGGALLNRPAAKIPVLKWRRCAVVAILAATACASPAQHRKPIYAKYRYTPSPAPTPSACALSLEKEHLAVAISHEPTFNQKHYLTAIVALNRALDLQKDCDDGSRGENAVHRARIYNALHVMDKDAGESGLARSDRKHAEEQYDLCARYLIGTPKGDECNRIENRLFLED